MLKITYNFLLLLAVQHLCLAQISTFSNVPSYSSPNFGTNLPAGSFPNAYSSASSASGVSGDQTFSFSPGNAFSPSVSSASASAGSSQAAPFPSSLETFITTFTNAVHSSPLLADTYDISQTSPQAFANFLYDAIHSHLLSNGVLDPHQLATSVAQPLKQNFLVVTYPLLVRINANAMGKNLLAEGILNSTNAASLALAFANEMEASALQTVKKDSPESKFQALGDGYVNFLKSNGLYSREKLPNVGKYYGDEVRSAAANSERKSLS